MVQPLPQLNLQAQREMPQGQSQYAEAIADFGNVMQRFSSSVSQQAQTQIGAQEKVEEMVLKTNIDNSMRDFARSNMNLFNPKAGIAGFEQQAKNYTDQLLKDKTGVQSDYIRAYAQHSMATNAHPLQQQVTKQAFNTARMQLLNSAENTQKTVSQLINQIPYEHAIEFHTLDEKERDGKDHPQLDAARHHMGEMLNQIDASVLAGILPAKMGDSIKKKLLTDGNDQMLYHTYNLAVESGQGDDFLQKYAQSQQGKDDPAKWAKHIAQFKKIEEHSLAEHAVSTETARKTIKDNLKEIEKGNESNAMADSLAAMAPTIFQDYNQDRKIASITGGLYKQFTNGTTQTASLLYADMVKNLRNSDRPEDEKYQMGLALNKASNLAQNYFREYANDPMKFIDENNLLGDIATTQQMNAQSGITNSKPWQNIDLKTLDSISALQQHNGRPLNQVQFLHNAEAKRQAGILMQANAADKVRMIENIQAKYKEYAPNVMNQLIGKGGLPSEYRYFTLLNPESGDLPQMVDAMTKKYNLSDEQTKSIKERVNKALNVTDDRAHPNVSTTRRVIGTLGAGIYGAVTGREVPATQSTTGLLGTPAVFDPQTTPPDVKLKALRESMTSIGGYNTVDIRNNLENTVTKLANFYVSEQNMSVDDAMTRAVSSLTNQYDMIDYRNNVIRMPRHKVNYHNLSTLLVNTPELLNKVNFDYPIHGDFGEPASRTDMIQYYKKNIQNGHWATDPNDQGVIWVNANGMVNKMSNGNPLFISFDSISQLDRLDFGRMSDNQVAFSSLKQAFDLFKSNNIAFNKEDLTRDHGHIPELDRIEDSFSTLEKLSGLALTRSKDLNQLLFEDRQAKQRKFSKRGGK